MTSSHVGLSAADIESFKTPQDPDSYSGYPSSEKQRIVYGLTDEVEILFGGALGGGKSDAILKDALQFVHVPGYSALILRRIEDDLLDLKDRLFLWLNDAKAHWNEKEGRWLFENGATIELGGVLHENSKYKYQGRQWQYIAFDELTQFTQSQYEFIRTRLRHQECKRHKGQDFDPECPLCHVAYVNSLVPLRIRSGSNPIGDGRQWVKTRFISEEAEADIEAGCAKDFYKKGPAVFIPSRVEDNPGLDSEAYFRTSLAHLSPGLRAQLVRGSWRVVEGAILDQKWYRYYRTRHQMLIRLDERGTPRGRIDERECHRFATIDTASTSTEEMKRKKAGKAPSWSVVAVWDWWTEDPSLFLRHVWRDRVDWNDLKTNVANTLAEWRPQIVHIENANCGKQLASEMRDRGWSVELFNPNQKAWSGQRGTPGKLDRSTEFQNMLAAGQLFLPEYATWLSDLEGEWVGWTGDEDDPADQIDVASMACILCAPRVLVATLEEAAMERVFDDPLAWEM